MIRRLKSLKYKQIHITVAIIATVMCIFVSCSEKTEQVEAITDRSTTPSLRATEVSTVVSDSGITRYRMKTPEWLIYDRAEVPYWDFPQGIHLEKFDTDLNVDAEVQSNYAIYYDKKRLWDLRDSVTAVNLEGERFESNQLFWDEISERIYSDDSIKITQKDKIIKGLGFESNQSLTKYVIRRPIGVFPLEE